MSSTAWLLLLVAAVATSGASCAARAPDERPASYAVTAGESFEIRLPANPTTGYRWELGKPIDEKVIRLVESHYEAAATDALGAGGASIWTFEGVAPGRTTIELVYLRPWERGVAPGRQAVYSVDVL